jgi:hypothetical protein
VTEAPRPTPFRRQQEALGATFAPTAGWLLPSDYGDPVAEDRSRRAAAAVVDRSAVGRIKVSGKDRLDFLQRLSTQDLKARLGPGHGAPTVFTTNKGRIVDLVTIYDLGETLLLLTSPSAREALPAWIRRYVLRDQVSLTDVSAEGAAFRIAGPQAPDVLRAIGAGAAAGLDRHGIAGLDPAGVGTAVIVEAAGPWPSFLLVADLPGAVELFAAAVEASRAVGGGPVGELVRTMGRIEDGIPEGGSELTEEFNPWEARLDEAISLSKGCYVGQEVVARLNTYDKVSRRLVGLRIGNAEPPAPGSKITVEGHESGVLTSSVRSFSAGETIGLGYIRVAHEAPGTEVLVGIAEGESVPARVTALPVAS